MEKVEDRNKGLKLLKESINDYLESEFGHTENNLFERDNVEQIAHSENEIGEELNVYIDIEQLEVIKCTYYNHYYQEREGFDTLEGLAEWFKNIDFEMLTSLNR